MGQGAGVLGRQSSPARASLCKKGGGLVRDQLTDWVDPPCFFDPIRFGSLQTTKIEKVM